jgi:uncharacterized protein (TIGR03083 family)
MSHEMAQLMEQAWSSFEEVCAQLDPGEWELPTDCPGWTVKDQLAHVCGIESSALGRPQPGDPVQAPHVKNELGAINEREILARRNRSVDELLDELRDATAERGKVLASWTHEEWNEDAQGVLGVMPRTRIIGMRIFDVFTHEQDIRVATGRAGHLNGDVARFAYTQMAGSMGFAVAKRAQAEDGQSVHFAIAPPGETFAIEMQGRRGVRLDAVPPEPTVRLATDFEVFLRLTAGRWSPQRVIEEGRLQVAGDTDLAERVLTGMNITP